MPLFKRSDPDLRSLIAYIVARARERDITLNQTKLVKLLYLIDVERAASGRAALTGLRWVFFHYGPYARELPTTVDAMEGRDIRTRVWKGTKLYASAPGAPDGDDWPPGTRRTVDGVLRRFAAMELDPLLDHVYFHTGPMIGAKRGEPLDLSRARSWQEPPRQSPLPPPAKPADIAKRLAQWRTRTAHTLAPASLDPPGRHFDDESSDLGGGVAARLSVPADNPPL